MNVPGKIVQRHFQLQQSSPRAIFLHGNRELEKERNKEPFDGAISP